MRKVLEIVAAVLLLLIAVQDSSAAGMVESEIDWLPLNRSEILGILSLAAETDPPTLQTLEEYASERHAAQKTGTTRTKRSEDKLAAFLERMAPDTVWIMYGSKLPFSVTMVGNEEQVHSLRITVPVVNHSAEESGRALEALSNLFVAIYPEAADAAKWPMESLGASWEASPLARKTPLPDPDDVFIRLSAGGVTSSTFGVPPDIVVYDITVREDCIPHVAQGNPFTRGIC